MLLSEIQNQTESMCLIALLSTWMAIKHVKEPKVWMIDLARRIEKAENER